MNFEVGIVTITMPKVYNNMVREFDNFDNEPSGMVNSFLSIKDFFIFSVAQSKKYLLADEIF